MAWKTHNMSAKQDTISHNKIDQNVIVELIIIIAISLVVYVFAVRYDMLEKIVEFSAQHERWEIDESGS